MAAAFIEAFLTWAPRILVIVMSILGAYFMWQWGNAITQGVQTAAPGLGAMVSAVGMMFSLLPVMMMIMFMMMIMNMFMSMMRW